MAAVAPRVDRVMKDVVAPPLHPLTINDIFDENDKVRLDVLKEHLMKEGRLEDGACLELTKRAAALMAKEPNMLNLQYPLTVCGDLHGQFFDLVRLIDVGGPPGETQYLFLGDYVDRGCFSCEVLWYMFALKISNPESFWMLRGNHECRQLTAFFNFKDECAYKYNITIYDAIMNCFDKLPLAALVSNSFFCVHGGLSPDITTLDQIAELERFSEIPREGPLCDLLWSDPYEGEQNSDEEGEDDEVRIGNEDWYGYNDTRQCSYVYGVEAVKEFLKENNLTSIVRAHEAQLDGFKMHMVNPHTSIPRVITIFSAPNYCDVYKNKAACLKFDNNVLNIKQFIDSAHPYYLPNFMDVFEWSLPFVAEKVTDMLANVIEMDDEDEDIQKEKPKEPTQVEARAGLLKKKVQAVSKMLRMFKVLRQESEAVLQLKKLTPNNKIPMGVLRAGPVAINKALSDFSEAQEADFLNEQRPSVNGTLRRIQKRQSHKLNQLPRRRSSVLHPDKIEKIVQAVEAMEDVDEAAVFKVEAPNVD